MKPFLYLSHGHGHAEKPVHRPYYDDLQWNWTWLSEMKWKFSSCRARERERKIMLMVAEHECLYGHGYVHLLPGANRTHIEILEEFEM